MNYGLFYNFNVGKIKDTVVQKQTIYVVFQLLHAAYLSNSYVHQGLLIFK